MWARHGLTPTHTSRGGHTHIRTHTVHPVADMALGGTQKMDDRERGSKVGGCT